MCTLWLRSLIINFERILIGTITEGDIRRALLEGIELTSSISPIIQRNPIYFSEELTLKEILEKLPIELQKRNRKSNRFLGKIIIIDRQNIPVKVLDYHELWEQKVATHRHLVVIGLGYVGLTMAVVMADSGFMVTGVEVDQSRFDMLNAGKSYIHEVGLQDLLKEHIHKNLKVSQVLPKDGDVFIISVGTPVVEVGHGKKETIIN